MLLTNVQFTKLQKQQSNYLKKVLLNFIFLRTMTNIEEYKNRSINSLVQELTHLGNREVINFQTQLVGIQNGQNNLVKRYQTKSIPPKQFFKLSKQGDKKYFYNSIITDLSEYSFDNFMQNWQKNYNCSIILKNNIQNLRKILSALHQWTMDCLTFGIVINKQNQIQDIFNKQKITHRQLVENKRFYQFNQGRNNQNNNQATEKIMQYLNNVLEKISSQQRQNTLIDIVFKNPQSYAQIHIILFPVDFFLSQCIMPFTLVKSQILQLLNYIKMNPNKRYEHISKLITKRLPLTNYFTKILMNDSCNLIFNHIQITKTSQFEVQKERIVGRFEFFDKLGIINNLLRKPDRMVLQIGVKKNMQNKQKAKSIQNRLQTVTSPKTGDRKEDANRSNKVKSQISPIAKLNRDTQIFQISNQNKNTLSQQQYEKQMRKTQTKQFQYCRSLQRKTHKYSISPRQDKYYITQNEDDKTNFKKLQSPQTNQFVNIKDLNQNKKTLTKYNKHNTQSLEDNHDVYQKQNILLNANYTQSQTITLLKASHARQISQYHQTIQLLNKKIIILTKQLNLQQLYKIHQREIMLLELKIQELRDDIINLTRDPNNQISQKSSKNIIKKLTEQLKSYQNSSATKKITQGKFLMLQKQLKQTKQKLTFSQKARSSLTLQVQALTKRLKIRDTQIQKINQDELQKYKCQQLSVTEQQLFEDIKKLVNAVKNQQRNSVEYLLRKVSLLLADLSKSRDIVLECNDFLVQLMEILDNKLSKKEPQIVLDCNKFIRSFLMENLAIF